MTLSSAEDVRALHDACDFAESVYLATCNRVHVVFVGRPHVSVSSYRRRVAQWFFARAASLHIACPDARSLMAYADEGAVEHLFVVAAALDSLVPGEAQILGQVKAAHRAAIEAGLCHEELNKVYRDAFAIAKEVREHTALGRGRTSMFSLATQLLQDHITKEVPTRRARLAIIGVGEMSAQCARWAQQRGDIDLTIVNRTVDKARALARGVQARAVSLQDFLRAPGAQDLLVSATSSKVPLLLTPTLQQLSKGALCIDLAVARDIDLQSAKAAQVSLWDIDRLQTRARAHAALRHQEIGEARLRIDQALERFRARQLGRNLGATIEAWRQTSELALQQELEEVLRARRRTTSPKEQQELQETLAAFGRRLLGRWLHGPTLGLKEVGRHFGHEAVDAFAGATMTPPHARRTRAR